MDPRSQLAQSAVIVFILGLALGVGALRRPRSAGGIYWGAVLTLAGLGVGFNALFHHLPPVFTLVLGNACVIGGDVLILVGVRRFKQQGLRPALPLGLFALGVANNFAYGVQEPSPNLRLAFNALIVGILFVLTALELLRDMPPAVRAPARINAGVYFFFTLLLLVRIGVVTLGPALADAAVVEGLQSFAHFVRIVAQVVITLLYGAILYGARLSEAESRALHDPLTGLLNSAGLSLQAAPWLAHCRREGKEAWVLLVDIDRFKDVNDRIGFTEGDRVLCEIAETLRQTLRGEDRIARTAGEKFGVLLGAATREQAAHAADRLRGAVGLITLAGERVSVSIGVADAGRYEHELNSAMVSAGDAPLRAKRSGRNRIEFANGDERGQMRSATV